MKKNIKKILFCYYCREYQSHSTLIYQTTAPNVYKPTPVHTQYSGSVYKDHGSVHKGHGSLYKDQGSLYKDQGILFKDNIYDVPYSNTKYTPVASTDVIDGSSGTRVSPKDVRFGSSDVRLGSNDLRVSPSEMRAPSDRTNASACSLARMSVKSRDYVKNSPKNKIRSSIIMNKSPLVSSQLVEIKKNLQYTTN